MGIGPLKSASIRPQTREPMPIIGVRRGEAQCAAHDACIAPAVAPPAPPLPSPEEGAFRLRSESVDSWTPGPKPLCHRHPTGPHLSGLPWTPWTLALLPAFRLGRELAADQRRLEVA